jgi:hypothetical protein
VTWDHVPASSGAGVAFGNEIPMLDAGYWILDILLMQ